MYSAEKRNAVLNMRCTAAARRYHAASTAAPKHSSLFLALLRRTR